MISLSRDIRSAWKLPFSGRELILALESMALDICGNPGLPGGPCPPAAFAASLGPGAARDFFELELALLDEDAMAGLNQSYLGCFGPTNVLAFPASAPLGPGFAPQAAEMRAGAESGGHSGATEKEPLPLGWLALCPDALLREAALYGQDTARHTLRLLGHGLAHLLGFEHGAAMDRAVAVAVAGAERLLAHQDLRPESVPPA